MSRFAAAAVAAAALALAACPAAESPEPAAAEPVRVESPGLGIAIAALHSPFEVGVNEGDELVLASPGGTLTVEVGPEQRAGINLVEEVKARKATFEAAPGGEYFGNRELMTPNGTAFTARGAYDGEAGRVEETWVYALHPAANRLLTVVYAYPPGEAENRVGHLLDVLGEIEALVTAGQ